MPSHVRHLLLLLCLTVASAHAQERLSLEVASLLERANTGDTSAQFLLANAYDSGRGAPRDGKEAMRWYRKAADRGYAEAQNSVGSGLQAEKRYAEALIWYEKASAQNHAVATNNLAYLHDLGLGVTQDRKRAFALYSRAADLGWAEAMWNLANMYGAGQLGTPPDLAAACTWTVRAQRFAAASEKQLVAHVARVMPMLERKLSSEELSSCREQGQFWSPPAAATRSDLPR
jgi:TPR repeat protein